MKKLFCICFLTVYSLQPTTLVYNLKIRRTFAGIGTLLKPDKRPLWVVSWVPIGYHRTAHIVRPESATDLYTRRHGGGAIFNLRRIPSKYWWLELTTAVQKESITACGSSNFCASRGGFDDVVLAAGCNFYVGDKGQGTLYGLAGFPTTRTASPFDAQEALVGTRFYALGGGVEGSYSFINNPLKNLVTIVQVRAIHFFNREWETILGPGGRIKPGELIDLLLSVRYRYKVSMVETGYNATFFTNQAAVLPTRTIENKTTLRNGFFISAMHLLQHATFFDKPVALGGGFQYNRISQFNANSYLAWLNLTVIF